MLATAESDLMSQGLGVVQAVSRRIARRLGGNVPPDDLVGIGNLALLDVVRTYDPSRASFVSYATSRLSWAILDGLRRETHVRTVAARALALIGSERLAEAHAEAAATAEPSTSIEEDQDALTRLLEGHAAALAVGLLTTPPETPHPETPEDALQQAQEAHAIKGVIAALPDREKTLMERHYYGGERFDVIARDPRHQQELGVPAARARDWRRPGGCVLRWGLRPQTPGLGRAPPRRRAW